MFIQLPALNESTILVFPRVSVCMNCGLSEFTIPGPELKELNDRSTEKRNNGRKYFSTS